MEFEIWWLLGVPLFFTLGWMAARVDIRQLLSESRSLPNGYFKGLNFLLNEQPDKAIDAFIEIVRLDPESVELHFALGNLFRRRGETERAIRVHQNLLARPDLPLEQKTKARFELGQDYLKAGLLDRAEETFTVLLSGPYEAQARRALLEIYQREKEWARAIDAAHALQEAGAGGRQKEIAQFYCEIAQDELVHTNAEAALAMLDKALATDRHNVRATILSGDVHQANGDTEKAVLTWRRVEQQSVPHVALVAQRLMDGYRTPTLLGLDKLLDARMIDAPPEVRPELAIVKNLVHGYAQKLARYQCSHCGFKARQFYWHCPGCSRWETYPPRRTEELNVMN